MNDREINPRYLPTMPPVTLTGMVLLVCDRFAAPGWVWGCVITLLALLWLAVIVRMGQTKWVRPSEI